MSFDNLSMLDEHGNNALMTALIQQSDRLAEILNEMNSFSSIDKNTLINQKNKLGFNALDFASDCQGQIEILLKSFSMSMNKYYGETVDASAQNIYQSLKNSWNLYVANPADADLEHSFESALEKAQPLFNEIDDNNEIIKTLFRLFKNFVSIFLTVDWSEKTYDSMNDAAQRFERVKGIVLIQNEVLKSVDTYSHDAVETPVELALEAVPVQGGNAPAQYEPLDDVPPLTDAVNDPDLEAAIALSMGGQSFFPPVSPVVGEPSAPPESDVLDADVPLTPPPGYNSN